MYRFILQSICEPHCQKPTTSSLSRNTGCLKTWSDEWMWCLCNSRHFTRDYTYFPTLSCTKSLCFSQKRWMRTLLKLDVLLRALSQRAPLTWMLSSFPQLSTRSPPKFFNSPCTYQSEMPPPLSSQVSFFKSTLVRCSHPACHKFFFTKGSWCVDHKWDVVRAWMFVRERTVCMRWVTGVLSWQWVWSLFV